MGMGGGKIRNKPKKRQERISIFANAGLFLNEGPKEIKNNNENQRVGEIGRAHV